MQTEAHTIAHVVTRVAGLDSAHERLEIKVSIRRVPGAEPLVHREAPVAAPAGHTGAPSTNAFAVDLTDANRAGLDNLAYRSTGRRRAKEYLINQAVAHYLALYQQSQEFTRWPRKRGEKRRIA